MKMTNEKEKITIDLSKGEKLTDIQVRERHYDKDCIHIWIKIDKA